MKRINIDEINFDLDYEGYYWLSNSNKPIMSHKISKDIFMELPFIVEGNFYAPEKEISISIKYLDGEYKIFQSELNALPANQITVDKYLAHDLNGIKKIIMIQYWKESSPDPLLEGMTTLIPDWHAFSGFEK